MYSTIARDEGVISGETVLFQVQKKICASIAHTILLNFHYYTAAIYTADNSHYSIVFTVINIFLLQYVFK